MSKPTCLWAGFLGALVLLAAAPACAIQDTSLSADWVRGSLENGILREAAPVSGFNSGDGHILSLSSERLRSSNHFLRETSAGNAAVDCGIDLTCFANVNADSRIGSNGGNFDMENAHGDAGLARFWAGTMYGLRVGRDQWKTGDQGNGEMRSLIADAARYEDAQVAAYGSLTLARLNYPGGNAALDSNYRALTGSLRHATTGGWQSVYSLQATVLRQDNLQHDAWLGSRGTQLRAVWEAQPIQGWDSRATVTTQAYRYGGVDPGLGVRRADHFSSLEFNLARMLDKRLQLRLEYIASRHDSNVPAPGNEWYSVGAGLQWKFD